MKFMNQIKKFGRALARHGRKVVAVAVGVVTLAGSAVKAQAYTNTISELQSASTGAITAMGDFQKTILLAGVPIVIGFLVWRLFRKGTSKAV